VAFRPCLGCGRKFFGGAEYTYVTWFVDEERFRVRYVECRSCAADRRNSALEAGDSWAGDEWVIAAPQVPVSEPQKLAGLPSQRVPRSAVNKEGVA
jgi:hypothetical protein